MEKKEYDCRRAALDGARSVLKGLGDAEDIAHDTLNSFYEELQAGKAIMDPENWCFIVAKRRALRYLKKYRREEALPEAFDQSYGSNTPDPEQQLLRREADTGLGRLLEITKSAADAVFTSEEQELTEMFFGESRSWPAIAAEKEKSEAKLKMQLSRAIRKKLRPEVRSRLESDRQLSELFEDLLSQGDSALTRVIRAALEQLSSGTMLL